MLFSVFGFSFFTIFFYSDLQSELNITCELLNLRSRVGLCNHQTIYTNTKQLCLLFSIVFRVVSESIRRWLRASLLVCFLPGRKKANVRFRKNESMNKMKEWNWIICWRRWREREIERDVINHKIGVSMYKMWVRLGYHLQPHHKYMEIVRNFLHHSNGQ